MLSERTKRLLPLICKRNTWDASLTPFSSLTYVKINPLRTMDPAFEENPGGVPIPEPKHLSLVRAGCGQANGMPAHILAEFVHPSRQVRTWEGTFTTKSN